MTLAPLTLASASPRRKELLERAGFAVKVVVPDVDEEPVAGETPVDYTKRLARTKVIAAVRRIESTMLPKEPVGPPRGFFQPTRNDEPLRWVLAADTVVAVDDVLLGKPVDLNEARDMLIRLSGREHWVITGFALYDMRREREGLQAVATAVRFKRLSRQEIEQYLSTGESMDKAGAYAIQGIGAYLVESIRGSYTNVVGLPLCQVVEMMEEMGAADIVPWGR